MTTDPKHVGALRDGIVELHDRTKELYHKYGGEPAEESPALRELRSFRLPVSITSVISSLTILSDHAADHLWAFVDTITEPINVNVGWTCVRSMLEPCAIGAWLADPSVDTTVRIERMFAFRYSGLDQQVKCGRAWSVPQVELDAAQARMDRVVADAAQLGYAPVVSKSGKTIGIGKQMPNATTVIGEMLGEEEVYRLLSAVAHGHVWAIRQLCYESAGTDGSIAGINAEAIEKTVSVDGTLLLGLTATKSFARLMWNQWDYMGWDALALEDVLESSADRMRVADSQRFWRGDGEGSQE